MNKSTKGKNPFADKLMNKDLNNPVNELVVFYPKENLFYKIAVIDYRNFRYELWGTKMTRWLGFGDAKLVNYRNKEEFDKYYELYSQYNSGTRGFMTKEEMIKWFEFCESRIEFLPDYLRVLEERKKEKEENERNFKK